MASTPSDISPIITTPGTPQFQGGGSFRVGTQAALFFYFTDINGNMYDPSDFSIEITDPDGDSAVSDADDPMDRLGVGEYAYIWNIPSTATTGLYTCTLTYIVETISGEETETYTQQFIVTETGPGSISYRQVASRAFLESLIGYCQRIPVFKEVIRLNNARTQGEVTFGRWNQSAKEKIFINGNLQESGYSVNYWTGKINFTTLLSDFDEAVCDYNFRWFKDEELDGFIEQGVNIVNIWPPQTVYTIANIEDRWIIAAEYGAAINAIRRLLMDLLFQEPIKVFGGLTRQNDIIGHLESLKKNYEDMLTKMLEQKKYFPYAGLTKTITTPEYTLPGGRSRWFRYLFKGAVIFFPFILSLTL